MNINVEMIEACLKTKAGFYGQTIYNICDGTTHYVPYGFWDIALTLVVVLFIISTAILILRVVFS